jgi:hypothetical protein
MMIGPNISLENPFRCPAGDTKIYSSRLNVLDIKFAQFPKRNFAAWMWTFYWGAWNACITAGFISDICCNMGGLCLWFVGLVAPRARIRTEIVTARIMCFFRRTDSDLRQTFRWPLCTPRIVKLRIWWSWRNFCEKTFLERIYLKDLWYGRIAIWRRVLSSGMWLRVVR